jgi:RimJ/RimL family protein N-acetyltransferase
VPGTAKAPETTETKRLSLRPPLLEDAELIFNSYAQDPDVLKYLLWRPHTSVTDTRSFLQFCQNCWDQGTAFPYIITQKESGQLLGMVEVRVEKDSANLGYVLAKEHWGQGFMVEALQPIIAWAIAQDGISKVWATCDVENLASARVLEKSGMKREEILPKHSLHPNISPEPRDAFRYSMDRNG